MTTKLPAALSPEVMAELAKPVQTYDRRNAEIAASEARWHVIEVHEPMQRDVMDELIARRFGIFVPEVDKTVISRGRKVARVLPMFPGYIFVFVWDIDQHWSRITPIHGVLRIMGEITDAKIDEIRAVENRERPLPAVGGKARHRGKRRRDNDVIATYPWSPFQDRLLTLDSEGRNQTLIRALGLA